MLGEGVSINAQGNLVIDAPLYVIDRNQESPGLKPTDASLNLPVTAFIYDNGDTLDCPLELTGGIVNGRIALIIKKPDEYLLTRNAADFWNVHEEYFKEGADAKNAQLLLYAGNPLDYNWIRLFSSPIIAYINWWEVDPYDVDGENHYFIYSLGVVSISDRINISSQDSKYTWYTDVDMELRNGWDIVGAENIFDETINDTINTITSTLPSSDFRRKNGD